MQWSDYFELWKSYEDIAKHFNELIIRNRLQALGGISATVAIVVGIFTQKALTEKREVAWAGLSAIFGLLAVFWLALAALDLMYYNQLLQGSVDAITELEKQSMPEVRAEPGAPVRIDMSHKGRIDMSTKIEEAVQMWEFPFFWQNYKIGPGIALFYGLVWVALVGSCIFCFYRYKRAKKPQS